MRYSRKRARKRGPGRRATDSALESIREDERTHIARELHDDLGQLLATLRVELTLLKRLPAGAPMTVDLIDSMDRVLLSALTSVRRIATDLRPRALDEGGLYFALQSLQRDFQHRHRIACTLEANEADLALDDRRSTAVYRIAQESLTNIARHADASEARLALRRYSNTLHITVSDNGRGISHTDLAKPASLGLLGMRERVTSLGGSMGVDGSSAGTRISITIPLPPMDSATEAAGAG